MVRELEDGTAWSSKKIVKELSVHAEENCIWFASTQGTIAKGNML
jgi:hypothetical protein